MQSSPLAYTLRPQNLSEFYGQRHLLGVNSALTRVLEGGALHSMIFWGPPGTGKTTLATMLAHRHKAQFVNLSAVNCGVKEVRQVVSEAAQRLDTKARQTVLFLDEVHRFNKGQQDAFLPHVENGTIVFVGATTENPSFSLNNALLSRTQVYVLKPLSPDELLQILGRAIEHEQPSLELSNDQLVQLAHGADGDARRALGLLELVLNASESNTKAAIDAAIADALNGQLRRFDNGGDEFYDQISALHKSVRGSDPDAALYWLCRMLDGGCDPQYVLRRVIRMASEDIGNADPRALWTALDCAAAYQRMGSPEGDLAIAQAVIYLACAPKSNAVYSAYKQARAQVQASGTLPVPNHLRNAPTKLTKNLGHGRHYKYAHDFEGGFVPGENYFPEQMPAQRFYHPVARGLEIQINARLDELRQLNLQSGTPQTKTPQTKTPKSNSNR